MNLNKDYNKLSSKYVLLLNTVIFSLRSESIYSFKKLNFNTLNRKKGTKYYKQTLRKQRQGFVAMCFAKRNAYLCSHAKLYDFINFKSFLMLLARIFGTADFGSCATSDFVLRRSKLNFLHGR